MIDNYDSFTYNLVQYLGELGAEVETVRNDAITQADLAGFAPAGVVISPGPCTPREAGVSLAAIAHFAGKVPVLGVCLGHQAIGMHFGANLVRSRHVMHGKTDRVRHGGSGVFTGLPQAFEVVRYHSLALRDLPAVLEATAWSSDEELMGLRHRELDVEGVQFHPESIASEFGYDMLASFLHRTGHQPRLPATHASSRPSPH
ncbi:MAG: aminodeoxychorismate/anthranilate synthase component II [Burkholderiaceae bacterium]